MDIRAEGRLAFPPERVFVAYRDDILELLPYLGNVRNIVVRSRKVEGPIVEMVNDWTGGGDIPAALRAFLSDSMLSWTDYATWNQDTLRCDWRIQTGTFSEAVQSAGQNAFESDGAGGSYLRVRGALEIDPKKLRGIPGFLAGKIARTLEGFLVDKIQANLVDTVTSLGTYMQKKEATSAERPLAEGAESSRT
jgi:hypothetical protein